MKKRHYGWLCNTWRALKLKEEEKLLAAATAGPFASFKKVPETQLLASSALPIVTPYVWVPDMCLSFRVDVGTLYDRETQVSRPLVLKKKNRIQVMDMLSITSFTYFGSLAT